MRLGQLVMLAGMVITVSALGFGMLLRSMEWEWGVLVFGCVVFYLGKVLAERQGAS